LREKVAQNLETEGYAESTQIFPSTFDDEDISTLLEEHLGVAGLIVEEHTLILESFIQKCVNKLKENMVQIIEDAENEALQALKPGEKKKKGKSGADKFPLSQNDISKVLQEKKVMEYIVDESQREAFFKHLVPRLDAEYLKLKEEMQNKKVAASSDVVADLSAKVEHLGMTLLLTNRTIKNMLESMPEFDSGAAEAMALSIVRPLVERIVFLNLKRFKIHVEPVNLYKKKAEEGRQQRLTPSCVF
jgi:DNA polymerase I-like protein with 3'-5' exonuclease and polymerase domains